MAVEVVRKTEYRKILDIRDRGKHPVHIIADLTVPWKVNELPQVTGQPKMLGLSILDDSTATGTILIVFDHGIETDIVEHGVVTKKDVEMFPESLKDEEEYRSDLINALQSEYDSGMAQYDYVIRDWTKGDTADTYIKKSAEYWPVLIRYNGSNPITYWISAESEEIENSETNISVVVNSNNISDVKYICIEMDHDDDDNRVINFTASDFSKNFEIPAKYNDTEYPTALFSALDAICHSHEYGDDYNVVKKELLDLLDSFDYDGFIKSLEPKMHAQGGGITVAQNPTAWVNEAEYTDDIEDEITPAEEDAVETALAAMREDNARDRAARKAAKSQYARHMEPARHRNDSNNVYHMDAAARSTESEEADITTNPKEVKMEDVRVVDADISVLHAFGTANIPIHNYTGYPIRIVDNAVMSHKAGRFVIPDEGPHIVATLPPEGKLTALDAVIELGSLNGIPVTEYYPSRITALPDVDGIILVSVAYYKAAIRMGFPVGNLFIPDTKLEWRDERTGKTVYYYSGITKRM